MAATSQKYKIKGTSAAATAKEVARQIAIKQRKDSRSKKSIYSQTRDPFVPSVPRGFVGSRGDAKYFDTALATYVADTTGQRTHLSIVPQGTTVNTREGKAFRCTSVNVRGKVSAGTTTTIANYAGYLVWDYQPNKALALVADILDTASSNSFPRRENNERFKIIKKYYGLVIGNTTTPTVGTEAYEIDDYVKLPKDANVLCTAADTTGAIGNTIQGALIWVSVGDIAAGTAAAQFVVGFRLNFTDRIN